MKTKTKRERRKQNGLKTRKEFWLPQETNYKIKDLALCLGQSETATIQQLVEEAYNRVNWAA